MFARIRAWSTTKKVVVFGLGGLVLLATITSGAFWAFVALAGVAAICVGTYALVAGSSRRFRLRSRGSAGVVVGLGVFALIVGASVNAAANPSAELQPAAQGSSPAAESPLATPSAPPEPVVTQEEVQETSAIPFERTSVDDGNRLAGSSAITTPGADGQRVTTYLVTYEDGVEVLRALIREEVAVPPVNEVTAIGTKAPPPVAPAPVAAPPAPAPPAGGGCHPSYEGACVPANASDVDCAGGSGNGPEYVAGPLRVVGDDVYDLERDDDGIACDV